MYFSLLVIAVTIGPGKSIGYIGSWKDIIPKLSFLYIFALFSTVRETKKYRNFFKQGKKTKSKDSQTTFRNGQNYNLNIGAVQHIQEK